MLRGLIASWISANVGFLMGVWWATRNGPPEREEHVKPQGFTPRVVPPEHEPPPSPFEDDGNWHRYSIRMDANGTTTYWRDGRQYYPDFPDHAPYE